MSFRLAEGKVYKNYQVIAQNNIPNKDIIRKKNKHKISPEGSVAITAKEVGSGEVKVLKLRYLTKSYALTQPSSPQQNKKNQ